MIFANNTKLSNIWKTKELSFDSSNGQDGNKNIAQMGYRTGLMGWFINYSLADRIHSRLNTVFQMQLF